MKGLTLTTKEQYTLSIMNAALEGSYDAAKVYMSVAHSLASHNHWVDNSFTA